MADRGAGEGHAVQASVKTSTPQELIAAIEGQSEALGRLESLKELSQRSLDESSTVFRRVLVDPAQPASVRAAAALEVGKHQSPSHQEALLAAVTTADPRVVRRSAEALGRSGDEVALETLRSIDPHPGPAQDSVNFAKTLLSYRLGLDANLLRSPSDYAVLDPGRREPVAAEVEPVAPAVVAEIARELGAELPGLLLQTEGAIRVRCGGTTFVAALNGDIGGFDEILKRPAVVAVVLKDPGSLGRLTLYEYLLTHPRHAGVADLLGVRSTGVVVHGGEVRLDSAAAEFELHAVDTPTALPVDIEGGYREDERMLSIERIYLHHDASRKQRPSAPRKLELPLRRPGALPASVDGSGRLF